MIGNTELSKDDVSAILKLNKSPLEITVSQGGDVELALAKALKVGKFSARAKALINQHAQIRASGAIQIGSFQIGIAVIMNPMNDLKTLKIGVSESLRRSVQSPTGRRKPLGN